MAEVEESLQTLLLDIISRSESTMFPSYGFPDTAWRWGNGVRVRVYREEFVQRGDAW